MFGDLGAFVSGTMFMGLFGADVGVRLAPEDAAELRAVEGAGPFGPAERPMGGYVALPASLVGAPGGPAAVPAPLFWPRRNRSPGIRV